MPCAVHFHASELLCYHVATVPPFFYTVSLPLSLSLSYFTCCQQRALISAGCEQDPSDQSAHLGERERADCINQFDNSCLLHLSSTWGPTRLHFLIHEILDAMYKQQQQKQCSMCRKPNCAPHSFLPRGCPNSTTACQVHPLRPKRLHAATAQTFAAAAAQDEPKEGENDCSAHSNHHNGPG